ncbi:protein of unknown function (plasmid) [Cupriavidus taiwanensis]|uniref:Uncharacterized protein n=1 Tax=Cupriavidus taiwanensis TaxID=164546 RepID=A0A9Q7V0T5_9BURK|nr:protein of unknown function [Cupriavidus taiwanensis]
MPRTSAHLGSRTAVQFRLTLSQDLMVGSPLDIRSLPSSVETVNRPLPALYQPRGYREKTLPHACYSQ